MKKEEINKFKEYAAMYWGQRVLKFSKTAPATQLVNSSMMDYITESCVLALRPLSDMTEDEKKELWHLDDHALHELGDGTGYALPYVFTWCLSKHFDLFGLIENNLAIDKTKP